MTASQRAFIAVFSLGGGPNQNPVHCASYGLPSRDDSCRYFHFLSNSGHCQAPGSPGRCGFDDTDSGLFVLGLYYQNRMVVRASAFMYHLARGANSPHLVIPWEEWGPRTCLRLRLRQKSCTTAIHRSGRTDAGASCGVARLLRLRARVEQALPFLAAPSRRFMR